MNNAEHVLRSEEFRELLTIPEQSVYMQRRIVLYCSALYCILSCFVLL